MPCSVELWTSNLVRLLRAIRAIFAPIVTKAFLFIARRSYASAVLGVIILPSIRSSVSLSVTRVLCDKTKQCTVDILIPYERATALVFWHRQTAYNVSTVRDTEKSSIIANIKLTTGFPTSYRWSAYVTTKSPKGGSKSDFFVFFKCYSTSVEWSLLQNFFVWKLPAANL